MNVLSLILGALSLLEAVAKLTKNTSDDKIAAEVSEAIRRLQNVVNQPVLKAQAEKIPAPFGT